MPPPPSAPLFVVEFAHEPIFRRCRFVLVSRVRPATNFAFGVVRNNEFHLTPVHATMQMRPCFQHIDDAKVRACTCCHGRAAERARCISPPKGVSMTPAVLCPSRQG